MNDFKKLLVWQEAVDFVAEIYQVTGEFPQSEKFNLTSQINRSAVSIPSNIAEGAGRYHKREFYNFLGYSNGSSNELETQLIIARNVDLLGADKFDYLGNKLNNIQKKIIKLSKTLV